MRLFNHLEPFSELAVVEERIHCEDNVNASAKLFVIVDLCEDPADGPECLSLLCWKDAEM
jgi:hypothetical protein